MSLLPSSKDNSPLLCPLQIVIVITKGYGLPWPKACFVAPVACFMSFLQALCGSSGKLLHTLCNPIQTAFWFMQFCQAGDNFILLFLFATFHVTTLSPAQSFHNKPSS